MGIFFNVTSRTRIKSGRSSLVKGSETLGVCRSVRVLESGKELLYLG